MSAGSKENQSPKGNEAKTKIDGVCQKVFFPIFLNPRPAHLTMTFEILFTRLDDDLFPSSHSESSSSLFFSLSDSIGSSTCSNENDTPAKSLRWRKSCTEYGVNFESLIYTSHEINR